MVPPEDLLGDDPPKPRPPPAPKKAPLPADDEDDGPDLLLQPASALPAPPAPPAAPASFPHVASPVKVPAPAPPPVSSGGGKRLRVALVAEATSAGVGRHFQDLAEGLAADGVDVVGIYSPARVDKQFQARLDSGRLPPMHSLPMRRAIHPLDLFDCNNLINLLRKLQPLDLVHGHSSKGGALARLAARWLKLPSVYTPNAFVTVDPQLPDWKRVVYGQAEKTLGAMGDAIICVSHEEFEEGLRLGIPRGKLHVVANGIAAPQLPARAELRRSWGLDDSHFVIGFVGRFNPQKAPERMLEAFSYVSRPFPHARLVMVGKGPLEEQLRRQALNAGVDDRIVWLGEYPGQQAMAGFDVFCLTSRYEGMPYVLLEALAAGLPIISTPVGGATMMIEPGVSGLIADAEKPLDYPRALHRLLEDAALRRAIVAAARLRAGKYPLERMVRETRAVYEKVLAARRG